MKRYSKEDAQKRLRACMENGTVEFHPHFHKRLLERKVEFTSAMHVLNKGIVRREPEFNVRFQEWRYLWKGTILSPRRTWESLLHLSKSTVGKSSFSP